MWDRLINKFFGYTIKREQHKQNQEWEEFVKKLEKAFPGKVRPLRGGWIT